MAAMCWLSWCCRIFIVAMQVLVVVSGMQTSLVITGRYTGIRDWTTVTSPLRWQNAGSNFKSVWWRSSQSNGKLNLKAQLSLWHSWPVVKVYMLIKASLSLSYLSTIHSSSLSTHSFSIPPHVSSLMPGSYIMVMPQGFHFSSGTFHWCVFSFPMLTECYDWGSPEVVERHFYCLRVRLRHFCLFLFLCLIVFYLENNTAR